MADKRQFIEFRRAHNNIRILVDVSDIRAISEQKDVGSGIYFYSDNKAKETVKDSYDSIIDKLSELNY